MRRRSSKLLRESKRPCPNLDRVFPFNANSRLEIQLTGKLDPAGEAENGIVDPATS
jgi:hypothetical protein